LDLKLRVVLPSDWDFILDLRNKFYSNFYEQKQPLQKNEHYAYMEKQKLNLNFHHWIIENDIISIGYVRILDNDIGIMIDDKYQNKGFASKALFIAEKEAKKLGVTKLIALVKIENKSSNKIFEKNNFKHVMSWLEKEI
jgi:RimJ/RimL family protein N-acetyltransferase